MKKGVIYKVTNKTNNKIYIGQSKNYKRRKYSHIYNSKKENPQFSLLDKAINKYGEDNFEWEIIWEGNYKYIDKKEIHYIKELNTQVPNGYNVEAGGKRVDNETQKVNKKIRYKIVLADLLFNRFVRQCIKNKLNVLLLDYDTWKYCVIETQRKQVYELFSININMFFKYEALINDKESYERIIKLINKTENINLKTVDLYDNIRIRHNLMEFPDEMIKYMSYDGIPYHVETIEQSLFVNDLDL